MDVLFAGSFGLGVSTMETGVGDYQRYLACTSKDIVRYWQSEIVNRSTLH